VFLRAESDRGPAYDVEIWLPQTVHHARLAWDAAGRAELAPPCPDAWAQEEAVKLARVLHREPAARMVRWRG
jgi:hypothetical protein